MGIIPTSHAQGQTQTPHFSSPSRVFHLLTVPVDMCVYLFIHVCVCAHTLTCV